MSAPLGYIPKKSAIAEIRQLLAQMQTAARDDAISKEMMERASHSISMLCEPYMAPRVFSDAVNIGLSKYEARLAEALFNNPGRTLGRDAIMNAMYFDSDKDPDHKIIDVVVCKIRKKLKKAIYGDEYYEIETVWGQGYRGVVVKGAELNTLGYA